MLGFAKFKTAKNTIYGIEIMNMIRKGQVVGAAREDILGRVKFINEIFGLAA
jgi:transposase, IS6 family